MAPLCQLNKPTLNVPSHKWDSRGYDVKIGENFCMLGYGNGIIVFTNDAALTDVDYKL